MPNWCSTKIEFTGAFADITDLHDKIIEYTSKELVPSGFGNSWLGNILAGFGFADRIDNGNDRIRCRGYVEDIADVTNRGDNSSFTVWTETAWIPMVKMWNTIIEQHYGNRISIHWIAEEEGYGYYTTNDIGWFGADYYHLFWSIDKADVCEGDYFNSPDEVANAINDLIANYELDAKSITENDINTAEHNKQDLTLSGDGWNITCCILAEVSDNDVE